MSASKPNLESFMAKKGEAQPLAVTAVPQRAPDTDAEPRPRALTLKLSERNYQRLRRYAFDHDLSHQAVLERALLDYLDRMGAK